MRKLRTLIATAWRRVEAASWRCQVLLLAGLALVVRIAIFGLCIAGRESRALEPDSSDYLTIAKHLGASYVSADAAYKQLSVERTPIYPAIVAAANRISDGLAPIIVVQILASVATVCVVAQFAKGLANPRAGLVAGLVVALDPLSVLYANQVLTETIFTLALLISVFALWRALAGSWRWSVLAGLALAAATLTRPAGLYLIAIAALIGLAATRRRVVVVLALVASFALPTGAWVVRNKIVADYAGVSSIQESNLLFYRAAGAISHDTGEPMGVVQSRLTREAERRLGRSSTVGARAAAYRRLALSHIRQHPVGAVYVTAHGVAAIMFGTGRSLERVLVGDRHPSLDRGIGLGLLLEVLVLLSGAGAGLIVLVRAKRWQAVGVVALLPAALVLISAGPEAYSRFRVPIVPFLAILFGIALCRPTFAQPASPSAS